jgi:hypothetical protein
MTSSGAAGRKVAMIPLLTPGARCVTLDRSKVTPPSSPHREPAPTTLRGQLCRRTRLARPFPNEGRSVSSPRARVGLSWAGAAGSAGDG